MGKSRVMLKHAFSGLGTMPGQHLLEQYVDEWCVGTGNVP